MRKKTRSQLVQCGISSMLSMLFLTAAGCATKAVRPPAPDQMGAEQRRNIVRRYTLKHYQKAVIPMVFPEHPAWHRQVDGDFYYPNLRKVFSEYENTALIKKRIDRRMRPAIILAWGSLLAYAPFSIRPGSYKYAIPLIGGLVAASWIFRVPQEWFGELTSTYNEELLRKYLGEYPVSISTESGVILEVDANPLDISMPEGEISYRSGCREKYVLGYGLLMAGGGTLSGVALLVISNFRYAIDKPHSDPKTFYVPLGAAVGLVAGIYTGVRAGNQKCRCK